MPSFFMETYGCQMNIADSSEVQELLKQSGWNEALKPEEASLVVINTCSVRKTAEDRVAGRLGYYKSLKRTSPRLKLAVMGCFAQKEQENLKKNFPVIDFVVGTRSKQAFYQILENWNPDKKTSFKDSVYTAMDSDFDLLPFAPEPNYPHRALVSIIKGCNNFCAYCIVPYTRGRELSLKSVVILEEIEKLAHTGVKEIFLLGQNVNSYGKDSGDLSFAELLSKINEIEGIERIKFMTSHPKDFSEELIEAVTGLSKLSRHVHLPLQSASNSVLERMNRGYTYEKYQKIIADLRSRDPQISLTTDLLTGFPGETAAEFEKTLKALSELELDRAFTFMYSAREGTASFAYPETVSPEEKQRRVQALIDLQHQMTYKRLSRFLGSTQRVLVDSSSKKNKTHLTGFTPYETAVIFQGDPSLIGTLREVKITGQKGMTLLGELV